MTTRIQNIKITAAALLFGAALALTASADIIKLKNGDTLEGIVISNDKNYVVIQMPSGEMGLDATFVDSIDKEKGPRSAGDLAKIRDASNARLESENSEREASFARTRAVVAADAAARRDHVTNTDEPTNAPAPTTVSERMSALDDALSQVPRKRDREKLRRLLLNFYFGGGVYDPVLRIAR
ncbi:MAG: hypothetical protein HY286_12915 [Planctomycetes bacterium]|nr:hypothetical protein [Planctomycetota bacterium]